MYDTTPDMPELRVHMDTTDWTTSMDVTSAVMRKGTLIDVQYSDGKGFGPLPITHLDVEPGGGAAAIILGHPSEMTARQRLRELTQEKMTLQQRLTDKNNLIEKLRKASRERASHLYDKRVELEQTIAELRKNLEHVQAERVQRVMGEESLPPSVQTGRVTDEDMQATGSLLEGGGPTSPTLWRQGTKVKQNVYAGDDPVAQFHDTEDARLVVEAVNDYVKRFSDAERRQHRVDVELHPDSPYVASTVISGPAETFEQAKATMSNVYEALCAADYPWVWITREDADTIVHRNQIRRVTIVKEDQS